MTYKTIKASWLIEKFKTMVIPGSEWKYVAGGSSEGAVDCSGAFSYWYKKAGSYMYHGSNTMWREYTVEKGKIGEITMIPGMAVFKMRRDGQEPSKFQNDGQGNFYHVGLYIGDNQVIEAKSPTRGCVTSKLSDWGYAAELKYTDYDEDESAATEPNEDDENNTAEDEQFDESIQTGTVVGGTLNLRASASTTATRLARIPNGTTIPILGESGAWYETQYDGNTGYVMKKYVQLTQNCWTVSGTMSDENDADTLVAYAAELGITLTKTKG